MTPQPLFIDVVSEAELLDAWNWLLKAVPKRSSPTGTEQFAKCFCSISGSTTELSHVASLFLSSIHLYESAQIDSLVIESKSFPTRLPMGSKLDTDVGKQLAKEDKFRALLSEHLAFWITLAIEQANKPTRAVATLPHTTAYTQGLDGVLATEDGGHLWVQIQSAKNSAIDPRKQVASGGARSGKRSPKRGKAVDDFLLIVEKYHSGLFTVQLDRHLADLCNRLGHTPKQEILYGLFAKAAFNAVVVANLKFATEKTFDGLERVTNDPLRRIATFIGSNDWTDFAAKIRSESQNKLAKAGIKL